MMQIFEKYGLKDEVGALQFFWIWGFKKNLIIQLDYTKLWDTKYKPWLGLEMDPDWPQKSTTRLLCFAL